MSGAAADDLRRWVRDHEVCWELSPLWELDQQRGRPPVRLQVGYEVSLLARLGGPGDRGAAVYQGLAALSRAVVPPAGRCTRCEVAPFDGAVRSRPESAWEPEVQLIVRVVHRRRYLSPVDACEKRCAEAIERGLRELGARPKAWRKVG